MRQLERVAHSDLAAARELVVLDLRDVSLIYSCAWRGILGLQGRTVHTGERFLTLARGELVGRILRTTHPDDVLGAVVEYAGGDAPPSQELGPAARRLAPRHADGGAPFNDHLRQLQRCFALYNDGSFRSWLGRIRAARAA